MYSYYQLILPLYLPSFLLFFSQGILLLVLPLYILDFNVSFSVVGLALAGQPLGMLLGDIPAGLMISRFGSKKTLLLGLTGFCIANIAMYFSSSISEVSLLQFLAGLGTAAFTVALHSSFIEMSQMESRGRAIAFTGGLVRLGRFAGPIAGGLIAAKFGLRGTFLLVGAAGILAMMFVMVYMRTPGTRPAYLQSNIKHHVLQLLRTLKSHYRIFISAGSGQFSAQALRSARLVVIPLFASDVLGLGVDRIGLIVSVSAAIDMSLFFVSGWLMDNLGRKFAIIPSYTIQAIGIVLVPFTSGFISLLFVSCFIGFGNGIGAGNMMTLGADLAPDDARGEFLGVWRLIGDGGHAGAPLVIGTVTEYLTFLGSCAVISSIGFLGVLVFLFAVPETLQRPGRRAA